MAMKKYMAILPHPGRREWGIIVGWVEGDPTKLESERQSLPETQQ
jgi:hypothetical protein